VPPRISGQFASPNGTTVRELDLPKCYEIRPRSFTDDRGVFSKPFDRNLFKKFGFDPQFAETFYTVSDANVLRGMHLQLPPAEHSKLVYCVAGRILDVALDLRFGRPTYGQHTSLELSADDRNVVYLPSGVAHGFYVLEAPSIVIYQVTSVHSPQLDAGIRWDSFGMKWPSQTPLISVRDNALPDLGTFKSPFDETTVASDH
jgi:dTDP-4-dehydrorhamnose 3,5-epimerase